MWHIYVPLWAMMGALGAVYAFKALESDPSYYEIREDLNNKVACIVILLIFMVLGLFGFFLGYFAYEGGKEE